MTTNIIDQIDWLEWFNYRTNLFPKTIEENSAELLSTIPSFVIDAYKNMRYSKHNEKLYVNAVYWLQNYIKIDVYKQTEKWRDLYFKTTVEFQKNKKNLLTYVIVELLDYLTFNKISRIDSEKKMNDEYLKYMNDVDKLKIKWKVGYK
jgi:hypothetical protein